MAVKNNLLLLLGEAQSQKKFTESKKSLYHGQGYGWQKGAFLDFWCPEAYICEIMTPDCLKFVWLITSPYLDPLTGNQFHNVRRCRINKFEKTELKKNP